MTDAEEYGLSNELDEIRKRKMDELKRKMDYPSSPIDLTASELEDALKKYSLVVVDCWTASCVFCKVIEPVIEELAKDYHGKIVFSRVNLDTERGVAEKFFIQAVPTLLVFKDGKLAETLTGALPKDQIKAKLDGIMQE